MLKGYILICRHAEGVHGQRKVGNPCSRPRAGLNKELNLALRAKEQGDDAPLPAFKGMRFIN